VSKEHDSLKKMKILLIEDSQEILAFLKHNLEAECFAVDVAQDGDKGIFMALTNEYDLIILDNILPKKSGLEVCTHLRAQKRSIPILMLSVKADPTIKAQLLNNGADDYLAKPFSFEELIARVRALLRRPIQITGEIIEVDDLIVNTKNQNVRRGKKEIKLTRKEFTLLEYMLRNLDVLLSRGMLLEHVWDMNMDPFSNTIESHIASLRKKVDLPGRRKLIHTLSGRGYKLTTLP